MRLLLVCLFVFSHGCSAQHHSPHHAPPRPHSPPIGAHPSTSAHHRKKTVGEAVKDKNVEALCSWNDCYNEKKPCQESTVSGAPKHRMKCFDYLVDEEGELVCPPNTADCRDRFMTKEEAIAVHYANRVPWMFVGLMFLVVAYYIEKNRRRARLRKYHPKGGYQGKFRTSLTDCICRPKMACLSVFAGSVLSTYNRVELEEREYSMLDFLVNYLCSLPVIFMNRQTLRRRMNVQPKPCEDACVSLCCGACVIGQHSLELELGVANLKDFVEEHEEEDEDQGSFSKY